MAQTPEVLFVNPDYLKEYTQLNGSVEESYFDSHVLLAQDKHLHTYLGTRLFTKLKDDVRDGSLSGAYETLVNEHVRKVVVWWTMVEMLPNLHVKIHDGGLVIRSFESAQPVSKADLTRLIDQARDNAMYYTERMVEYLRHNTSTFPEYSRSEPGDILPEKQVYSVAGYEIGGGTRSGSYRREQLWRSIIRP